MPSPGRFTERITSAADIKAMAQQARQTVSHEAECPPTATGSDTGVGASPYGHYSFGRYGHGFGGWPLGTYRASARTDLPTAQAARATVGVDSNGDGKPDYYVTGVDRDGDGIPDAIQQPRYGCGPELRLPHKYAHNAGYYNPGLQPTGYYPGYHAGHPPPTPVTHASVLHGSPMRYTSAPDAHRRVADVPPPSGTPPTISYHPQEPSEPSQIKDNVSFVQDIREQNALKEHLTGVRMVPRATAAVDINGDGKPDYLVSGSDHNNDGIPDGMQAYSQHRLVDTAGEYYATHNYSPYNHPYRVLPDTGFYHPYYHPYARVEYQSPNWWPKATNRASANDRT